MLPINFSLLMKRSYQIALVVTFPLLGGTLLLGLSVLLAYFIEFNSPEEFRDDAPTRAIVSIFLFVGVPMVGYVIIFNLLFLVAKFKAQLSWTKYYLSGLAVNVLLLSLALVVTPIIMGGTIEGIGHFFMSFALVLLIYAVVQSPALSLLISRRVG
jgi:hypothetical protein